MMATSEHISHLERLAYRFRTAILAYNQTPEGQMSTNWHFGRFPHTSCRQSSICLCYWLNSLGIGSFLVASGQRPGWSISDPRDHAWVESVDSDILIDITLDQFGEHHPPLLVRRGMPDFHARHRENYTREVIEALPYPEVYEGVVACLAK